jgi:general secretion pathway protein B
VLRLSDLSAEERKSLPPLKLSMHMWNPDPAKRFVILDGNRIGEGDRIGDAVVAAITTDGVELDWNGRRLQVPIR